MRRKPRPGYRWAKRPDFYVTRRWEFGRVWHIVRVKGRMGVWLGAYQHEWSAYRAIDTAVHQRSVDVPEGDIDHPLFMELVPPPADDAVDPVNRGSNV